MQRVEEVGLSETIQKSEKLEFERDITFAFFVFKLEKFLREERKFNPNKS